MKFFLALISFFVYFLSFSNVSHAIAASSNFTTDYNVTYQVLDDATTHATFNITLTNKSSQYYASSYSVQVGFKNIENVVAKDREGQIIPKVTKNNEGSDIQLTFNEKSVGLNKKLPFTISFDTKDIAQKSGNIWDINIPGLAKQKDYNIFNVNVIVPSSLGEPSYIKPDVGKFNKNVLSFNKEQLGESGISISYGAEEVYNFNLTYHLKNSNLFPIKTEIALPPTTNYQDIEIKDMNPKPLNVTIDQDGNWLAQYSLAPSKKLDVNVKGKAKISLHPKKEVFSENDLKKYLKEEPFWQTKNSKIKELASKLRTPYEIYQYVVSNLKYDFNRVTTGEPRIGAVEVLNNPSSAVCLEFTDLFIAIARAAGIPAREVNGFAYTQNSKERPLSLVKDVLHAWPEYYDYELQTWVMVDPTWGNTTGGVDYFYTLDFDHLAFVIKGVNSTYPVPAGGYKITGDKASKDIDVELGNDFDAAAQTITFSENFSDDYFSGTSIKGNVLVKNTGFLMTTPQEINVNASFLEPKSQTISFGAIPPFGYLEIPIIFKDPQLLTNTSDNVKIAINQNYISKNIKISPFILNKWTILGGILFATTIISVSAFAFKPGNLPLFKQRK